ncbi:MAG: phosphatidylserine decarboxylase [SAR86 cluster bacterium]|uniref:Phosphatidylserine decarboxylase proenzyme n=1 Tax=SAR86 cluster bacterium TaxID=2030880 RepID=A0A2A5CJ55_9GAMM|nr:MAG: phosphatidylserine decarboxylase [SAR86 cluster bacterium]
MNLLFIFFQYIVPQHFLSRAIGLLANCKIAFIKNFLIKIFIKKYKVNLAEAEIKSAEEFSCFNDFFTRNLEPDARPIDAEANAIICPVDGAVSAIGDIEIGKIFQAKGKSFSLSALLGGDQKLADAFHGGKFATLYLSPRDYHRIHMPLTGTLEEMIYIPGKLFSVNQTTAANIDELFAKNERVVCIFKTDIGPMAVILVGAMIVASIETVWAGQVAPSKLNKHVERYQEHAPITIRRGEEMGRFKLGSTAIVLFPANVMSWESSLQTASGIQLGQKIGTIA